MGEAVSQTTIKAHTSMQVTNAGTIQAPKLWSPEAPNLYTLKTYISYQKSYQVHEMKVGIRNFRFHPDRGFFLNGKSYKLKGVCLHHDAGCLGAAVPYEIWCRRLIKLKKMGCNAIRMSHIRTCPSCTRCATSLAFL